MSNELFGRYLASRQEKHNVEYCYLFYLKPPPHVINRKSDEKSIPGPTTISLT